MSQQIAVVCDRCGHTLLPDEKCANAALPIADDFEPGEVSFSTFDLCSRCTRQLIRWATANQPLPTQRGNAGTG
jgi:hypothetical protein